MSKKFNDNMGNISSAFDRSDDETQENHNYNNDNGYILHPPSTIYQNTQCIARRRVRRRRSRQMNSEMIGEENRNINRMHDFSSPNDNIIQRPRRQTTRRNVHRNYPTVQTVNTDNFYNSNTIQENNDSAAPRRTQKRRGRRPKAFYCALDGMNLGQNTNDVNNVNNQQSSNYDSKETCRNPENSNERTLSCEEDDNNKDIPEPKPQQVRKTKRRYRRRRKTVKQTAMKTNIKQEPTENSSVIEIPIDDMGQEIRVDEIQNQNETSNECKSQQGTALGDKQGKNPAQKNENPSSDSEERLYERLRAKWRSRSVRRVPRKRGSSDVHGSNMGASTMAKRRRTFRQTRKRRRTRNPAGKEKRHDTSASADDLHGKKSREQSEESNHLEEHARYRLSHKAQPKRRRARARPTSGSEKEKKTTRKVARKRHRRSATRRSSDGDTGKKTNREGRERSSSSSQDGRATPKRRRRRAESQCSGTDSSSKKKAGGKKKTKITNVQKNKNSNRKSTDRKSQENKKRSQTPKRKS